MNQGWIKLHRQITEWEWYTDGNTFRVFLHLIINANHKPNRYKGVLIERGQILTGRKSLAAALELTERQVRTALNKLKKSGEITQKTASKTTKSGSIITICNYDSYQEQKELSDQQNDQQTTKKRPANDQEATKKRPANDQEATTNKNDKNDNNEKNDKNEKNFLQQKKNEKSPDDIEKNLRQFFNENEHIKRKLFLDVEKSCGRTLTVSEKKAIAQRITIFANDYVLRPSWNPSEPVETKVIRFTNYIINSIKNGYELTNNNSGQAANSNKKGFRVSKEFEGLLDEIESNKQDRYGYMENDPFARGSKLYLAKSNN